MVRSTPQLPRMQNQSRTRAPLERNGQVATQTVEKKEKGNKPPVMRQYELLDRVRRYNPNTDEALLNRAYVYAMKAHGEQKRASGDPYFSHPLEVAAILTDLKLDDATIAAALLHDTIEDTAATRGEIDKVFGPDIGTLVDGLTKLKKLDLVTKEAKQAENLRKLLLAIADDVRVLLVKLADRLHNMRTLHFVSPEVKRRNAEETIEIYAPLAGRMGMQEMREELEDLSFRELYPDAYRVVTERLTTLAERNHDLTTEIEQQLTKKLADRGIAAMVKGRQKRPYSIWRKMERKSVGFEQLSDLFAFRVIVKTVGGLLPGARHRAHDLAGRAGPVQGLHLDAQAERLSLDPHHRDRPRPAARRIADPHAARWTTSPNTASPRTRSTRTMPDRRPRCCRGNRTPMRGCAGPSSSWRKAPIRKNSSNTPSSNCSTTRCSASRRRAS